eukprot:1121168-Amphidinium_carterae.1
MLLGSVLENFAYYSLLYLEELGSKSPISDASQFKLMIKPLSFKLLSAGSGAMGHALTRRFPHLGQA